MSRHIIPPTYIGQIVTFHSPLPDEDADQLYVVIELITDVPKPRGRIRALNTTLNFPSIESVLLADLTVIQ